MGKLKSAGLDPARRLKKQEERKNMIKITLKNSQEVTWKQEEYDDYIYDGRFFIVIKGLQWIGFYNLDSVISVTINN